MKRTSFRKVSYSCQPEMRSALISQISPPLGHKPAAQFELELKQHYGSPCGLMADFPPAPQTALLAGHFMTANLVSFSYQRPGQVRESPWRRAR